MERAAIWTTRANVGSRQTTLAILTALFAIGVSGGLVAGAGLVESDFAVKVALLIGMVIVAVAMVAYRPVLFPFSAYIVAVPFDNILQTGAGTATKFLAIASVAVILIVMVDRRRTVGPPIAVVAWAVLLLWGIASLLWSPAPLPSGQLWATVGLFLVFVVVAMLMVRPQETYFLAAATIAGGVVLASYGIMLYLQGSDMISNGAAEERLIVRGTSSSIIDPNHFAASLIVPITLAMVLALRRNSWTKWLAALALFVLLGGVYVTAARGTMVAVGVIMLYLLIFYRQRLQLGAFALIGLLLSAGMPSVWMRFLDPSQGQASGRFGIWGLAWIAFKAHWLFGIGAAQFRMAYEEAYLKSSLGADARRWMEDSHNLIVGTSVELGIIGLVLMLVAWYFQFRVVRAIPPSSQLFELRVAVEASTLGLFVVAMSLDVMFYKYLWLGFMMALLVRNAYLAETTVAAAVQQPSVPRFAAISGDQQIV